MISLKEQLLKKQARESAKKVALTLADGSTVEVDLVKPTTGEKLRTMEAATLAGEIDKDGQPTSPLNSAKLTTRMMVVLVYANGSPVFDDGDREALLEAPYFEQLAIAVGELANPDTEDLRGK